MADTLKQAVTPDEIWADFLLNKLIPECATRGWMVMFESVKDGCCAIFAETVPLEAITAVGEVPVMTWEEFLRSELGLDAD